MGDRGNIVIVQHAGVDGGESARIYLYAHWGGSVIARVVQCALLRAPDRWDDEPYLGRIIFNELTAGSERENLSFGVSTYLTDNEHDLVVVDAEKQVVAIQPPGGPPSKTFGFAEFAKLDLVGAKLVDEPMACMGGGQLTRSGASDGPISGFATDPRSEPASSAPVGHLPYLLVGAVAGAVAMRIAHKAMGG